MADRIAKGISILFHPVLLPFYILIFLLNQSLIFAVEISFNSKLILLGVVFLSTVTFPFLSVWLFYKLHLVRSIRLETREERIYPLLIIAIFYYMTFYLLKTFPASFLFSYYMLGSIFLIVLALIFSIKIKISLHMIGIGGILGSFIGLAIRLSLDLSSLIIPTIMLSGIIGSARLIENSHKPSEIYYGFLAGVGVMMMLFLLI